MTIERQAKMRRMARDIAGRWQSNPLLAAAPRGLLALRELNEKARTKGLPFIRKPPAKIYGRIGNLEVRLAQGRKDIQRAQRLRYEVFYEEMSATPSVIAGMRRLDQDPYDAICDHLLVEDRSLDAAFEPEAWMRTRKPHVVGTYRVLRQEVAQRSLGFYTASEYDIGPMIAAKSPRYRFMELGRSCVRQPYRTKRSVELLTCKLSSMKF